MGNELSQEEQDQILEEAYNLEDPQADKYLNSGTAAPNCQPKHTQKEQRRDKLREMDEGKDTLDEGKLPNNTHKHRRASSTVSEREDQEERRKRQHQSGNKANNEQEMSAAEQQKKLSYFQMARLGYQELVNAIIRPPRADYKVSTVLISRFFIILELGSMRARAPI
jgi:hypothetical protein